MKKGGVRMGKKDTSPKNYTYFMDEETRKGVTSKWLIQDSKPALSGFRAFPTSQPCLMNGFCSQGTYRIVRRLNYRGKSTVVSSISRCHVGFPVCGQGSPLPPQRYRRRNHHFLLSVNVVRIGPLPR